MRQRREDCDPAGNVESLSSIGRTWMMLEIYVEEERFYVGSGA